MKKFANFFAAAVFLFVFVSLNVHSETLYQSKCSSCHGSDGNKKALGTSEILKGQSKDEIKNKLNGYKEGTYGGSKKNIMKLQVKSLSEADIEKLATEISDF